MTRVQLSAVRTDGGTQTRAGLDLAVVAEYAAAMQAGAVFPAVVVFEDANGSTWLADGFQRQAAAIEAGLVELAADVPQGSRRDAVLFSAGANEAHGLRRSNADKRVGVVALLNDADWCQWSDREIARRCGVGHPIVADVRQSLTGSSSSDARTDTTKHGTTATMDTGRIGAVLAVTEGAATAPPPWLPKQGQAAIGTVETNGQRHQVWIVPSDDAGDFVYVTATFTDGTGVNLPMSVDGTKKPVLREWAPFVIEGFRLPLERATWEYRDMRWPYPMFLYTSRADWFSRVVLGQADGVTS